MSFLFDRRLSVTLADLFRLVEDGLPPGYHISKPRATRTGQTLAVDIFGRVPEHCEYLCPSVGCVVGTAHGEKTQVKILARDWERHLPPEARTAFLDVQPRDPSDILQDLAWYIMDKTGDIDDAPAQPTGGAALDNGQDKEESTESVLAVEYRTRLRRNLAKHFSKDDLRTLCFDLGIEHENLPEAKDGMVRELVAHCERTGRVPEFVAQCGELRPNVSWEDKPE